MATCMLEKHSPNCSIHNPPPILLFKSVFACISLVPTAVQVRKAAEDITEEASGIQIKTERLHKSVGSEGGGGASWGLFLFSADLSPSESDLPPPCKSSECRILGPLLKPLVPCHSPPSSHRAQENSPGMRSTPSEAPRQNVPSSLSFVLWPGTHGRCCSQLTVHTS